MNPIIKNIRALSRFSAMGLMSVGIYLIWLIGSIFVSNKILWRQRIFSKWSKLAVRISKMKIEVRGNPPREPFFLVSNHLGYMDIPAIRSVIKGVFIAKSEVAKWFFVGRFVGAMGTVFVDRNNRRKILNSGERVIERIESGESLIFFPEGTSSNGEKILPFKSSFLEFAATKNLPVSYSSINYKIPGSAEKAGDKICWWGDADFLPHLWRLFQIKTFTTVITFGDEPICNPNRKELARQLHGKVSQNFIPVV